MKSPLTLAAIAAAVCTLTLSACGGGGGGDSPAIASDTSQSSSSNTNTAGSGASTTPTPGNNGSTDAGSSVTPQYEALPSPYDLTGMLDLLNQEGAKGYRYLSDGNFTADGNTVVNGVTIPGVAKSIFVRDGLAPTYSYEALSSADTVAGMVDQANAEGLKGYHYERNFSPNIQNPTTQDFLNPSLYTLYRKDGVSTATYTHIADQASSSGTSNDFLVQANDRGRSGYAYVAPINALGSTTSIFNLYIKNNASGARYTYEALPSAATQSGFLDQLNSEGLRGYRAKGGIRFPGQPDQAYEVYIKDQTQSATFTWRNETPQASSIGGINQANSLAAQGYTYYGDVALIDTSIPSTSQMVLYFKASNCTGFLCVSLNPLTQN